MDGYCGEREGENIGKGKCRNMGNRGEDKRRGYSRIAKNRKEGGENGRRKSGRSWTEKGILYGRRGIARSSSDSICSEASRYAANLLLCLTPFTH